MSKASPKSLDELLKNIPNPSPKKKEEAIVKDNNDPKEEIKLPPAKDNANEVSSGQDKQNEETVIPKVEKEINQEEDQPESEGKVKNWKEIILKRIKNIDENMVVAPTVAHKEILQQLKGELEFVLNHP